MCLAVWAAWPCAAAFAQTAVDGEIAGQVVDSAGHGIAGVHVVLRAVDFQAPFDTPGNPAPLEYLRPARLAAEATTGPGGQFLLLRVQPGDYLAAAGVFGRGNGGERVHVAAGEISETRLILGALSTNPSSTPADPDPSAAEALQWLQSDAPWAQAEQPGGVHSVQPVPTDSTDEAPSDAVAHDGSSTHTDAEALSIDGLAATQTAATIDGMSAANFAGTAHTSATARWAIGLASGAVRVPRFERTFSAQYSGIAGGMLAAATRSGGPRWHGTAGLALRHSAWAAGNPFAIETHFHSGLPSSALVKPPDTDLTLLGRAGGPLPWRGITAFAAAEERWRNAAVISSPQLPQFYALTPTQAALLGTRGVSPAQTSAALQYLDSLTGHLDRRVRHAREFLRLDFKPGARDSLALTYARTRLSEPAMPLGALSSGVMARGLASVGDASTRLDTIQTRWTHPFSSRANNEFRILWAAGLHTELPHAPLPQEPAISPGGYAPEVRIQAGEFSFGTPAALGQTANPDEQRWAAADLVQFAAARHVLTAGAEWGRIHQRIDVLSDAAGSFHYDSGGTRGRAGGLVDWITDFTFNVRAYPNGACPSILAPVHTFCFRSFTQSFGGSQTSFVQHDLAAFIEDRWRLREGLTAELGARYEYVLLPLPQRPNGALDAAFSAIGTTNSFPEDRNNIGPRASLAWAPSGGRWGTMRLGYGVFYGRLPAATLRAALEDTALPSSTTRIHITPATITACPQVAGQGFGYACAYPAAPPAAVAATTRAILFARNFRLPAVQRAELSIERGFTRSLTLRATYATAMATQLPKTTDVNIAGAGQMRSFVLQGGELRPGVRDGQTFAVPVYSQRLLPQFGPVSALLSNANATWHAGRLETRLQTAGLHARVSYTWSRAIDFGAEQLGTPRVNAQFDPLDVRYDKAVADTNLPHQLTGFVTWSSRLTAGPEALRRLLGGWRFGALGSASSGRPYSYEIFGGTRLSGGAYTINGSGGATYLPTVGRNTLRLPMRWSADARLGRSFRLTDRLHAELYADAYNVANHVNPTRVNARAFLVGDVLAGATQLLYQDAKTIAAEGLNTPSFGTLTSSTAGMDRERRGQVGLRLEF